MRKLLVVGVIILLLGMSIPSTGIIADKKFNIRNFNNGSLSGYIKDTSMNPIEGARVRVYFHGTYEQNYSDTSGHYHVTNIPICNCTKNCTAFIPGYKPESVLLSINENSSYDFVLKSDNIFYVGGSGPGNYTKIQDAIDNATDGDTVFVYSNTYTENLSMNKSIDLIGENKLNTFLNGSRIVIEESFIKIINFTIQNGNRIYTSFSSNDKPISNLTISCNILKSDDTYIGIGGIELFNVTNATITHNTFINCGLWLFSLTSEIYHMAPYHNTILNNTVNGKPLVYLENTSDRDINDAGQVIISDCNNITIENLEITNTIIGIQVISCTDCYILHNNFSKNALMAISLINSNNITIHNNYIHNSEIGILLIASKFNDISNNDFKTIGGCIFFDKSPDNLMSKNNFRYSFTLWMYKGMLSIDSDNTWTENYWNRPRILPVFILRYKDVYSNRIKRRFDIDWHPARKPYDI